MPAPIMQREAPRTLLQPRSALVTQAHLSPCRFSRLLQFETVSSPTAEHHVVLPEEFQCMDAWLPSAYPLVWQHLRVEKASLLGSRLAGRPLPFTPLFAGLHYCTQHRHGSSYPTAVQ